MQGKRECSVRETSELIYTIVPNFLSFFLSFAFAGLFSVSFAFAHISFSVKRDCSTSAPRLCATLLHRSSTLPGIAPLPLIVPTNGIVNCGPVTSRHLASSRLIPPDGYRRLLPSTANRAPRLPVLMYSCALGCTFTGQICRKREFERAEWIDIADDEGS